MPLVMAVYSSILDSNGAGGNSKPRSGRDAIEVCECTGAACIGAGRRTVLSEHCHQLLVDGRSRDGVAEYDDVGWGLTEPTVEDLGARAARAEVELREQPACSDLAAADRLEPALQSPRERESAESNPTRVQQKD